MVEAEFIASIINGAYQVYALQAFDELACDDTQHFLITHHLSGNLKTLVLYNGTTEGSVSHAYYSTIHTVHGRKIHLLPQPLNAVHMLTYRLVHFTC